MLKPGDRIERRYRIQRFVAAGGFGEVYLATDTNFGRDVALKRIKEQSLDLKARESFKQEARRQSQLSGHPHVVTVYDIGDAVYEGEEFPFCTMEWLPGGTLQQMVPAGGMRPDVTNVRRWIAQTADALDYASVQRGMIHRDVKPHNIFRDDRGNAKLGDFGLAKMTEGGLAVMSQGIGTLVFMPPEQFRTGSVITPAADVFALGCTLWLLLVGRPPLQYGGQMLNDPTFKTPRLGNVFQDCPPELDELMVHMLLKEPGDRPTAAEVREILMEGVSGTTSLAASPGRGAAGPMTTGASGPQSRRTGLLSGWSIFKPQTAAKSLLLPTQDAVMSTERIAEEAPTTAASLTRGRTLADVPMEIEGLARWTDPDETSPLPEGAILGMGSPRFRHDGAVTAVAAMPDGLKAVTGCGDKKLRVWNLATGVEELVLEGHADPVISIALSGDGRRAVTGAGDKSIRIWDLVSGYQIAELKGHTDAISCVALTPNGRAIVSGSKDRSLQVWDADAGRDLFFLGRHTAAVRSLAVTPDGLFVISAGDDGEIRLWDLESRSEVARMTGPQDQTGIIYQLVLSGDGKLAYSGLYSGRIAVWDLEAGQLLNYLDGSPGAVTSLSVTPDGRRLVSAGLPSAQADATTEQRRDYRVRVWDLSTGRLDHEMGGHQGVINSVCVTRDGGFALSASEDRTLRVWDLGTFREHRRLTGHTRTVSCVAIAANGVRAISGSWDNTLRVWRLQNGGELGKLEGHTSIVYAVSITPDGERAVSVSGDTTGIVWYLDSGQELGRLRGHSAAVRCVAVTPDGKRAVTASDDRSLRIWDLATARELKRYPLTGYTAYSMVMHPDGKRVLLAADDKSVRVVELETGRERRKLVGHTGSIHSLAIGGNGKFLVTGAADSTIRIWDMDSGRERRTLKGHESNVYSVAATADGRQVVSVGYDMTVRLWDAESGKCLGYIVNDFEPICMTLSPDGRWVLTGNQNTTLTVFPANALNNGSV